MTDLPTAAQSAAANRWWWDHDAAHYHKEHPEYLQSFYWCPEMLHEKDAKLLGDISDADVLEIGCGSAPCSQWLHETYPTAHITAFDISRGMLSYQDSSQPPAHINTAPETHPIHFVQADAQHMPFKARSFDIAFSVFGAIPFISDSAAFMRDVYELLKPGGRFVFSVTHPMRWIFPDDPTERGLQVYTSYFDRTPYSEKNSRTGSYTYVEHHRTMADRINELIGAGFILDQLLEPEWPEDLTLSWGQWSKLRGELFPGTAIFVAHRPAHDRH